MARRRSRRRRTNNKNAKSGGLTLRVVSLLAFLGFVFILAVALWISQILAIDQVAQQQRDAKHAIAKSLASQLTQSIASEVHTLETLARDPQLIALVARGDNAAIAQRAAELRKAFALVLNLRIIRRGEAKPDKNTTPHIGYACVDLMSNAATNKKFPLIEVHVPNTAQQHIDIVRPIINNGRVVGIIQLALDVRALKTWLLTVIGKHYAELNQKIDQDKSVQLAAAGEEILKTGPGTTYTIGGTQWTITVWSKTTSLLAMGLEALIVFFLAVGLAGLVVYILNRALSHALRVDLNNILQLTRDKLGGNKQHDYQLQMPEFIDAARSIGELSYDSKLQERERDDDPDSISFGQGELDTIDTLYMSSDSMAVEELDEDASTAMLRQVKAKAAAAQQPVRDSDSNPFLNQHHLPVADVETVDSNTSSVQATSVPTTSSVSKPSTRSAPITTDMSLTPPAEIFKAYDIRGVVGVSLSAQHATLIGQALGSEAKQRGLDTIAFARDGRLSGPELGQALVAGLQQAGMHVIDVGMVPTPVLYYAATELAQGSGVMLTGSHNPPNYNGFKMMLGGETLSGDQIQQLHQRIEQQDFASGEGSYSNQQVLENYLQRILTDVKLTRPLNIVIDCGNGVAGVVAPALFKGLGCQVTELYCDVDGKFPNHHPDPSKPENLNDLINMVKTKRADIGLAFDGDGDRLGVVDSGGNIIYPDRLMMMFAADILSRNHGAQIIYDIKCSSNLTKVIWERGGEPLMWKTGHSLIKAKMKQSGALLAGEMSGHIFFKERWYGFDDGLYSGVRLLEILAKDMRKSNVLFAALPDAVNTPEINISMREGEHHQFIDDLMMKADFGDANITMIDGIRADFADGWGLVRASNTTPVLVLRFEGQTEQAMKRIQNEFKKQMQAIKPDLKIPF